jgi:hypothetical protein
MGGCGPDKDCSANSTLPSLRGTGRSRLARGRTTHRPRNPGARRRSSSRCTSVRRTLTASVAARWPKNRARRLDFKVGEAFHAGPFLSFSLGRYTSESHSPESPASTNPGSTGARVTCSTRPSTSCSPSGCVEPLLSDNADCALALPSVGTSRSREQSAVRVDSV